MRKIPAPPGWSRSLTSVGVTGTNGKTTTTRWVAACLARLARPVAQVTTLGSFLDDVPMDVRADFPGFLRTMRAGLDAGGRFASVELTSEALARGFAHSWPFTIGVFTNLTRDHLDAHGSPEHYLASKAQLFAALPVGGTAILNVADPASELIAEVTPKAAQVVGYAVPSRGAPTRQPELVASTVEVSWSGTRVRIEACGALAHAPSPVDVRGVGDVFAENALAAVASALVAGVPAADIAEVLAHVPAPPGRFELVDADAKPRVVVDYAHTPDALGRTLATARRLCDGKVWVVFGAGGGRDRGKRAPMGTAAAAADVVVLTSDNPRAEDPVKIAHEIRAGVARGVDVHVHIDRRDAIRWAVLTASENDVIIVAGKGHELMQIVGSRALPFDDAQQVRAALAERTCAPRTTKQPAARADSP